jgi:hypothetical protein
MTSNSGKGDSPMESTADRTVDPALDPSLGVDYRMAGDVRRMLNDRANAVAYGNTDRVKHIDRDLLAAGFKGDPEAFQGGNWTRTPVGRTSGKPNVTSPVVTDPPAKTSTGGVTSSLLSGSATTATPSAPATS